MYFRIFTSTRKTASPASLCWEQQVAVSENVGVRKPEILVPLCATSLLVFGRNRHQDASKAKAEV